jgi:hypothetical protein
MPKHVGVDLECINKKHYFLEHLLVFLQMMVCLYLVNNNFSFTVSLILIMRLAVLLAKLTYMQLAFFFSCPGKRLNKISPVTDIPYNKNV